MVDAVKMSLGLSSTEKAKQNSYYNYSKGKGTVDALSANPDVASTAETAPIVGLKPTGATGVVPKSSAEQAAGNYIAPVKATMRESFGAGFAGAGIQYARDIRSALIYERDPNFDSKALSDEFFTNFGAGTPDEVKYLADSKTYQDWEDRQNYIQDKRMRSAAIADNMVSGIAGSIIDADLLVTAVPIVGWASKGGTVARTANRVGAGVIAASATAGVQSTLGDGLLRSEGEQMADVAIVGLARTLAPMAKGEVIASPRPVTNLTGGITPIKPTVPTESLTDINAKWEAASAQARSTPLTNAEIDSLPKKGRGAARRELQASKRAAAQAEVDAKFKPLADDAKAYEDTLASDALIKELSQQAVDELEQLRNMPNGTPAQKVARNKHIAAMQSTWDELNYYTGGDTNSGVNKLLSNPAVNNGDDVVSAQNVYNNNYGTRLLVIEDALKDAVAATGVRSNPWTRISGAYGRATKEVSADFQEVLQKVDADVIEYYAKFNKLPDANGYEQLIQMYTPKPHIQELLRKYINSGLAEQVHKDFSGKGIITKEVLDEAGNIKVVDAAEDIIRRPTYMNLRHSYDKIEDTVFSRGVATMDEVADFIGAQIVKQYPDLLKPKNAAKTFVLTERQVGQHFLQTQKDVAQGLSDVTALGMNKEQITTLLTKTGNLSDKDARIIAADVFGEMHKKGTSTPKNLRKRIGWDWNMRLRTEAGHDLTMRDLVDDNVLGNLEDYTRGMSHRLGLADYGIKSETELTNLLEGYLSKLPKDVDRQKARQFMKNTKDTLMGRPIDNNPVPQGVRSAQAMADLFLLANSGLYTFMDIATQMQKVGLLKSLPAFKRGMSTMFKDLKHFSSTEAKDLEDILTGRMLVNSRHRNFTVRYADNFAVGGGVHEAAQYYGQTARFMNLSESLKRFQVGVLAGVYTSNLKNAMKGSTKELQFMKDKLLIDDALLKDIQGQYAKHGTDIDSWSNGVRVKYEQKLFHDADNLAMSIHNGEVPAILEYSAVGRVIFPYMRFALGMQNKVLRRTLARDGNAGLAKLLAVQIPTAMLIGAAINVRLGKDPMQDLEKSALRSMTALGALNYPIELAMGGLDGGGVTAKVPFDKSYKFGKEVLTGGGDGEVTAIQLVKNSPLNSNVILDYLMLATED